MELDNTKETNGTTPRKRENGLRLRPVLPDASGVGLPYAPVDWPKKGDVWTWKVGRRVAITGHFLDRYLYPPKRLHNLLNSGRKRGLASKLSVERYVQMAFPDADINAFFASFIWKIPAKKHSLTNVARAIFVAPSEELADLSVTEPQYDGLTCKAGNKKCNSLFAESESSSLVPLPCDLCCDEPHFCHDCCCILCSKTIDLNYGGYSYIKCEAMVDGCVCGHVAHLNCALRCYMAGTVGGSIGLDAEYYCRRCDAKTCLVPHVTRLLKTCESIDSPDDIEKILNIGVCILRGSQKTNARVLLNHIDSAITKLKCGTSLGDIWKVKEIDSAISAGVLHNGIEELEPSNHQDSLDSGPCLVSVLSISSDYQSEYQKLEYEIDQVLQALRKAQESEYKIAEERLDAQKNYLRNLYEQLDKEKSELSSRASGTEADALLNAILNRVDQIKQEVMKLKEMEEVANGFGRTPKGTLKKHFGLEIED
ncbi:protein OBERON 2-like [Durio zibethinus]|uniref:Protein OBERON 2-like n=1 Tax=Durio zibethinus TaxID=66656 RepID=A0A6P5YF07_DURZI|nr:protein OBERON 2-like [Durio zibethinus]XP_022738908.1 protein OBERON 2-like [Durio zibethinus]XP_022738916.1 protein OBERON 2-like [Durio zibethinus]XP_022738926.1 protein OBERON 2-like [Durio zibethinus]XP_022738935.1 protein OBERON 2-like [Durio zibethinus]